DSIAAYDERSTLVVRVLDERGPLAHASLDVSMSRSVSAIDSSGSHVPSACWFPFGDVVVSDADGLVRIPLADRDQFKSPFPGKGPLLKRIASDSLQVEVWRADSFGELELDGPFEAGEIRTPDVLLQRLPVIVSGHVVESDGRPVAGADVYLVDGRHN